MVKNYSPGYTLLETLIVVVIIGLIASLGYANYRDYQRNQALTAAVRDLESNLRHAQELAFSGTKPDTGACGNDNFNLKGIVVQFSSPTEYNIYARCTDDPADYILLRSYQTPGNTTIISVVPEILFNSVGKGTDLAADLNLSVCSNSAGKGLIVKKNGQLLKTDTNFCP